MNPTPCDPPARARPAASFRPARPLRRTRWLALGVSALALAGCSGSGGPPPAHPIRDSATLLSAIRARAARVPSVRAEGSVEHFGRQGRVRGNITIFVMQPDRVRVDTFAFGHLVSSMVLNAEHFTLLQGQEYVTGPARACVAAQLLGVALEPREVLAVLSGGVPLVSERISAPVWENDGYSVRVEGDDGQSERIEFTLPSAERSLPEAEQHPQVHRVVLNDRQGQRGVITYEAYRTVNGIPFPQRVHIEMPRDHADTMLRFDTITPNYTIPPNPDAPDAPLPDPFQQTRPAGAHDVPINC